MTLRKVQLGSEIEPSAEPAEGSIRRRETTSDVGWDDGSASGVERHSSRFPTLPTPVEVSDLESLRTGDPALHRNVLEMITAIENDMLPPDVQMMMVQAMSPAVRREVVMKIAGLEASVLMTFKDQIHLVDTVLRNVVSKEGKLITGADTYGVTVKEAMNMSLKLSTTMVRDLPKIYSIERVQRAERALFEVVEKHLTREQQAKVLEELEKLNLEE